MPSAPDFLCSRPVQLRALAASLKDAFAANELELTARMKRSAPKRFTLSSWNSGSASLPRMPQAANISPSGSILRSGTRSEESVHTDADRCREARERVKHHGAAACPPCETGTASPPARPPAASRNIEKKAIAFS